MKKTLVTIGLILLAATAVLAHGELSAQINQLTQQIKLDEKNANLYLQRGELYRLNGNAKAALEDYDRTQKLSPELSEVDLARARLFFDAAMPEMAKFSLKRFLQIQPHHTEALILLAKTHRIEKDFKAALAQYDQAISTASKLKPDYFMARAEILMKLKCGDEALRGIDEGMEKLGNLISLQEKAIGYETQLKRWDAALNRIDKVIEQFNRKETWLVRRAEILRKANRQEEAKITAQKALEQINGLPDHLRNTAAMVSLKVAAGKIKN
jgi:tetratricopeptide (TPR) repeat protein